MTGIAPEVRALYQHGFELVTAARLDDACQKVGAQEDRPGVAFFPADVSVEDMARVAEDIAPCLTGGMRSVGLLGNVADRARVRGLRDLGVSWCVHPPFSADDVHLAASLALAEGSWGDLRKEPRVPVTMQVDVARNGGIGPARVRDLSVHGMFLVMPNPPEPGSAVKIQAQLGSDVWMLDGTVVHCSARSGPGQESGAGVQLGPLDADAERALQLFVDARIGSVRF